MSSLWAGRTEMVCDHTLTNQVLFTKNDPESWISVDLVSAMCCPNGYSLAHRVDMPRYFIRNWEFQGSVNGMHWECIFRHVNDETLNPDCLHASWVVQTQSFYRVFRLYLTGDGNSRGTNTLVGTCFDLYGAIRPVY